MSATQTEIDLTTLPLKIEYVTRHAGLQRDIDEKPWPCFEWRVTLSSKSGTWSTPYYCGMAHVMPRKKTPWGESSEPKPKAPSVADVLHGLTLDASAENDNFRDWCENYGYSDDSIRALNMYRQCLDTGVALRKYLGRDVVAQITKQLEDH